MQDSTKGNGTAEHTTLPDHSAGLVVAGQAFHWFDPVASCAEFGRVLQVGRDSGVGLNMRLRMHRDS
ncbi:MAG: methyltransferase domain-containing protein [Chloroflexota bacterium]